MELDHCNTFFNFDNFYSALSFSPGKRAKSSTPAINRHGNSNCFWNGLFRVTKLHPSGLGSKKCSGQSFPNACPKFFHHSNHHLDVRINMFIFNFPFQGWGQQHLQDCWLWPGQINQRGWIRGEGRSKISNQVDSSRSCKLFQVFD